ncbi:uncharacterized protein LOC132185076 [Corylus avellana]|uniref:uncharacterized protein LOC132185076 n=1 Tax=Corylus avellana TaxID=13451 RepID=UPI00286CF20E|nr:uncharacterized protein LOC132185076 [Corylus avellana]
MVFGGNSSFAILGSLPNPNPDDRDDNLIVFTFENLEDLTRVLENSPWNIKGSPLFLKKWSHEDAIEDLDFLKAAYWVQIHNLPLDLVTVENANDNLKPSRKSFLRIRVLLNLLNPLVPGFTHHRPPKAPLWVQYKYERLSDYCYTCGRLGHLSFSCPVDPKPPDHGRYGDKLKASPPNTNRVVQLIQPRRQMSVIEGSNELAIVPVPNQPSTESTHFSTPGHPHQTHQDHSTSSRSFPNPQEFLFRKFFGSRGGGLQSAPTSSMKVLAWNCRGLARGPTIRALRALIRTHHPDLIFLFETKIPSFHFRTSLFGLGFSKWLEVPPVGSQGGLFLSWKDDVDVEPVRLDKNCISCIVYSDPLHRPWLFSGVYVPHTSQRRSEFWPLLARLEKSGSRAFGSSSHGDFVDFVHSNALVDLGFVGNRFTWSNCRMGRANIRERLDRGLANQSWVHLFPNSLINHFLATQSDHCPLLISTSSTYRNLPKPFRFEAFWTKDKSSHGVVAEAWLGEVEGSLAFSLSRKWKNTKNALKNWNHHHFGHIQHKIKSLMADISVIQSIPHFVGNAATEQVLQEDLQEQLLREEVLWKQKSRELWLTCTDLNTKFFHASTVCCRRYNSVSSLKTIEGITIVGRENIGNYLVQHISNQFTTTNPNLDSSLSDLVDKVVTDEENVSLCVILDEYEIFSAISNLGLNKAPGPDGMTVLFSKNCHVSSKASINEILNLARIPARAKYLGIPLFMHRNKQDSFVELKDRIFAKISGWRARLLSQAARTTLIKLVANAIPTYLMSLFLLPKAWCSAINSGLRKFWWGYPQEKN